MNSNLLGSELEEMIAERLVQKVGSKFFGITGVSLSLSLRFHGRTRQAYREKRIAYPPRCRSSFKKRIPFFRPSDSDSDPFVATVRRAKRAEEVNR